MAKQIILQVQFNDAVTGELVTGNLTQEMWDKLSVVLEQRLADFVKQRGLKKDLE